LDAKLGDIDRAEQFWRQIDNTQLQDSLGRELQEEQNVRGIGKTKAEIIADRVSLGSRGRREHAVTERVQGRAALPENEALLEQKAKEYAQTQEISINIGLDGLTKILHESRKFLSSWETNSKDDRYNVLRERAERKLGILANGTHRDPSPIYAAVYAPNGHDEYHGPADLYGDVFVLLQKDRVKSRTIFSTDDSVNEDPAYCNLSWEDAAYIKAAKDINERPAEEYVIGEEYVEAQVLGGVTVDDIASINIPIISANGEPKPDADAIRTRVEQLHREFPNVIFNLIEKIEDSQAKDIPLAA